MKIVHRTCLDQCQFGTPWQKRAAVLTSRVDTHALARVVHLSSCLLLVPLPSCVPWQCQCQRFLDGPPQCSSVRNQMQMYCPHPARRPSRPAGRGHVWWPVPASRKNELERWVRCSQREEKLGGRTIHGERRRLIFSCQSFSKIERS